MKNKKGIQLSVNFIVMLIIALVVFAFGINFMYDLITKAEEIRQDVDDNTQREIEASLTGGDIVSIPINHKETKIGESVIFGLGIFNVEKTQAFTIEMSFESAYNSKTKAPISVNGEDWIISSYGPYELAKNEQKIIGLPIRVPRNIESGKTPSGVYSFNIEVKNAEGLRYGNLQKVRITVE
ncbi:MAG: hypothetical protein KAQ83_03185 [Nanoarchaeota archaeon]|nr:hypothetical protein [Nanoarchaeota archaeon]